MANARTGRVVRTDAKVCHVDIEGRIVQAAPRGKLFEDLGPRRNPVAVGDQVRLELEGDRASIEEVLPRRNYLGRLASSHDPREQVLVANVDRLFVVGSIANPGFSSNRTDRILAACVWHDIPAALVLNKIDLAEPEAVEAVRTTYADAGFPVFATSATRGDGVEELRGELRGKLSAFSGASGVGKSSLLNALQPGLKLKVGKISRFWETGRHTTNAAQLHALDFGGWVIDTPGIRVFRLHGVTSGELRGLFPEFARFQEGCRYADCTHTHEPECAVVEALERGEIAATRYASYLEMREEVAPGAEEEESPEGEVAEGGEE
jgi:ribosome biogenesis GTPase